MFCQFIKNNNEQCKHKSTNEFNNTDTGNSNNQIILLCTRHYNKIIKEINTNTITSNDTGNSIDKEINSIDKEINTNTGNINDNLLFINKINGHVDILEDKNKKNLYKLIKLNANKNILEYEYKLLKYKLQNHKNIIKCNKYILNNEYNYYLKYEYVTLSYNQFKDNNKSNNYNSIINDIYIQLINVIKYIHSKKILFLYLNPDYLRFEFIDNKYIIKIIDFTNCIQYINNNSEFYENYKLITRHNNDIFGSRNVNLGYRGIRFDDYESILYILLDLLNNKTIKKIKNLKQIGRIVDKKNKILNTRYNIDYIDNLIDIINKNIDSNNINKDLSNKNAGIYFK